MRVLVVEDEKVIRNNYVDILHNAGHKTDAVADGASAMAYLDGLAKYDLLILDVMTPRMGGLEFLMEANKRNFDVPAIVVTGYSPELAQGIRNVVKVITKPVSELRLLEAVEEVTHDE